MSASWAPDQELMMKTIEVLQCCHSPNTEVQIQVHQTLTEYKRDPNFNRYLLCVLVQGIPAELGWRPEEVEATRSVAGLVLKNNIRQMHEQQIPHEVLEAVKSQCLHAIGDSSELIRTTVGLLITALALRNGLANYGGLQNWPSLLPTLLHCIREPNTNMVLGAFSTLQKICEDSTHEILTLNGVLQELLPTFIQFLEHPMPKIRVHALACANQFLHHSLNPADARQSVLEELGLFEKFLQGVFSLTSDTNSEVRCNVVQALVGVFDIDPERMSPWLSNLVDYMLQSTADQDEQVAQEACEFWLNLADEESALAILGPKLPQLIPLLLQHMRYSEMDVFLLKGDEDDADVEDQAQDIRPHIVKAKRMGATEDDSDSEDDDACDALSEWSLRKSAAASLDVLSNVYGDNYTKAQQNQGVDVIGSGHFLEILLPFLNDMLGSVEWEHQESGILALGAIAEGCIDGLSQHLPQLIPYLIRALNSEKALIRSITCWTLSRYAGWVLMMAEPMGNPGSELLPQLLEQLLKRVLDRNKRVQEASCSALAVLEEEANGSASLIPYLRHILETLVAAHGRYQAKGMMILYDAIQTLADAVGNELNRPEFIELLMPPLMDKWRSRDNQDPNLPHLLECLTSVAVALGQGFIPYCPEVHQRCLSIIKTDLQQEQMFHSDPENFAEPEKDFVIVALDLLSAVAEGVGPAIESLISGSDILPLMLHYATCPQDEVRQSTFALIGDYAKSCFVHLKPFLAGADKNGQIGGFLPILAQNLEPNKVPVCNNATWAIGEIAMRLGDDMKQFLPQIVQALVLLIENPQNHLPILENAGITLGRLAVACPHEIASILPRFFTAWCKYMRSFKNNDEKRDAFEGICKVIMNNPQLIAESLPFFCTAVISWDMQSLEKYDQLRPMFTQILQFYKQSLSPQDWEGYFLQFPKQLQDPLRQMYGL